jgi:hypothetical protein
MAKQLARDEPGPVGGEGLYDRDLYTWCMEQAALLRAGRLDAVDLAHVGRGDQSPWARSRERAGVEPARPCSTVKWRYQPGSTPELTARSSRERLQAPALRETRA